MNRAEAERLVEGVLTGPYTEAEFRRLVVNIFPDMEPKTDRWTGAYVPEAFRGGVAQYSRLGKVEDAEGYTVDILAVKLKNAGTLERARTLQRNFVARYLNGGRGGALRDAALVAFYADGSPDWRFSLVRMDYALDPERNKIRKDFTPARRYSFLVGGTEKTHTAKRQLATLLQGGSVTLTDLERAFNIESVTKEFFDAYKGLFIGLKEELDALEQHDPRIRAEFAAKHIDTATFAKRLLGQIVFLYFLQKKGWLGVGRNADGSLGSWGTGPKDFLRRLYDKQVAPYDNFFDDLLEPLFYEALARERDESAFYSRFNCRIPFLNGGLFEPVGDYNWAETRINLRNETFGQIFSTFDLYNFTVREDEPLDKEVAVDPEMLGKVFENLLEVRDRKSKGAFYTPREIVHYMCQESLINYLDTAVNTVTRPLLRPAPEQDDLFGRPRTRQGPLTEEAYEERVPRADLAEFIRLGDAAQEHDAATAARERETDAYRFKVPGSVRAHAAAIDRALADIKICDPAIGSGAFPVGMMNEIVRARGALNPYLGTENRAAYDFKRHAIQESIYGVDIEESAVDIAKLRLWLSLIVDEDDYGTIKPLPNLEYKIVIGNSLLGVEETLFNNELFERLERLKGQYFGETRPQEKGRLKGDIAEIIRQLTRGEADFDFKVYFSEVFQARGGFDIVIGNPPYVRQESLGTLKPVFKKNYSAYHGSADLFVYFIELGVKLLKRRGVFSYIVANKWMRANYGKPLRQWLKKQRLLQIIDYGDLPVFETATTYPCILFVSRDEPSQEVRVVKMEELAFYNLSSYIEENGYAQPQHDLDDSGWSLVNDEEQGVLSKLQSGKVTLENYVGTNIYYGIKTGLTEAFVINDKTRDQLILEDAKSVEVIKPFVLGRNIKRYQTPLSGKHLIFFPNGWTNKVSGNHPDKWVWLKDKYPAVAKHINVFSEEAKKRYDQGDYWWELRPCSYYQAFEQPKIMYVKFQVKPSFTFDDGGILSNDAIWIIPKDDKYLLGVLNSKIGWFLISLGVTHLQDSAPFLGKSPGDGRGKAVQPSE